MKIRAFFIPSLQIFKNSIYWPHNLSLNSNNYLISIHPTKPRTFDLFSYRKIHSKHLYNTFKQPPIISKNDDLRHSRSLWRNRTKIRRSTHNTFIMGHHRLVDEMIYRMDHLRSLRTRKAARLQICENAAPCWFSPPNYGVFRIFYFVDFRLWWWAKNRKLVYIICAFFLWVNKTRGWTS